jgi:hypothetical protein
MMISRKGGLSYVNRGDPTIVDKSLGNLINDGAWHDLDLSAICGAGKRLLVLQANVAGGVGSGIVQFKQKGITHNINVVAILTKAGYNEIKDVLVQTNASGVIQYYISSGATIGACDLCVRGWFDGAIV